MTLPLTAKSTPNRKSRIRFGASQFEILEPEIAFERPAAQLGDTGLPGAFENVRYIDGVGIRLAPKGWTEEGSYEFGGLTELAGSAASLFSYVVTKRNEPLTDVTYNGDILGDGNMLTKRVPAGDSWDNSLAADESAYPAPTVTTGTTLDRVWVSTANHDPEDMVVFEAFVPGRRLDGKAGVATFYFSGPASTAESFTGTGQMALTLSSDGSATIRERNSAGEWKVRKEFTLQTYGQGTHWRLYISSNCTKNGSGVWKGSTLQIAAVGMMPREKTSTFSPILATTAAQAILNGHPEYILYKVGSKQRAATTPSKIRVDVRRDIRVHFNQYGPAFAPEGVLTDQIIPFPMYTSTAGEIRVDTYVDRPSGTSVNVRMFNAETGTELTGTTFVDDAVGLSVDFVLPKVVPSSLNSGRYYRIKVEFTANGAGTKSPTLTGISVFRRAVRGERDDPYVDWPLRGSGGDASLPIRSISKVSITGETSDPTSAGASLSLADLTNSAPSVRNKGGLPVRIDILDDSNALTSILFRGLTVQNRTVAIPGKTGKYPAPNSWKGEILVKGEWERVNRQLTAAQILLLDADDRDKPAKITDSIRNLFYSMGYTTGEIDVPDLTLRLMNAADDPIRIEPDTRYSDVILQLNRDYLGGLLVRDENAGAGTAGMWRLLVKPKPPYHTVLKFKRSHPGALKLPHMPEAYGTEVGAEDQVIQILPVLTQAEKLVEPPEGNVVIVIGGSDLTSEKPKQLMQVCVNVKSLNVAGLADSHANYPDPFHPDALLDYVPIVVRDITLSTEDAVNFVARRTFEAACHSLTTRRFDSFLPLITDVTDEKQIRPRQPRVGDMCVFEDEDGEFRDYVIVRCDPYWTKCHSMRASFEIARTEAMDQYASYGATVEYRKFLLRLMRRTMEVAGLSGGSQQTSERSRQVSNQRSQWSALPAEVISPIQDLDPESPTFGDFTGPAGYV